MTMVIVVIMFSLASETVYSKLRTFRQNGGYRHWTIADGMSRVGLNLGDDVAFIGFSDFGYAAFWARLARVRIIAEILPEDSAAFWAANALVKSRVLKAFARIGIKGIVAEYPAPGDSTKGWQRIGNTNYYVIFPDSTLAIEE